MPRRRESGRRAETRREGQFGRSLYVSVTGILASVLFACLSILYPSLLPSLSDLLNYPTTATTTTTTTSSTSHTSQSELESTFRTVGNLDSMTITSTAMKNVVVVGGSYVGCATAQQLAAILPPTHRVLLVEPHSHFNHLFTFPRFAVVPSHEHKAFIPYTYEFHKETIPNPSLHSVVRARVLSVSPDHVTLDRAWQGSTTLPFEYLAIATGTRLRPPGNMESDDKLPSVEYFKTHQSRIASADKITIVGGGAVGVQMATDIKEVYPTKEVTVIQSRERVMPRFHPHMHEIVSARFTELGINLITGTRVVFPPEGFPLDGSEFTLVLNDGRSVRTNLVVAATGQVANNELLASLPTSKPDGIINPDNGFIRVLPTMQFQESQYPNMFAVGDIADTKAHKAARAGAAQAAVLAQNVASMVDGKPPVAEIEVGPAGIHMTLGLQKNILFRNPAPGESDPFVKWKDDGSADMHVDGIWGRRGFKITGPADYHL